MRTLGEQKLDFLINVPLNKCAADIPILFNSYILINYFNFLNYIAMQNGGLSRMLGSNNPYSLWSGGGVTGTGPLQIPGMSNKVDPYAPLNSKQLQNLYSTGRLSNSQMSVGQLAGGNMNFNSMFGPTKQEQEDDEVAADDEEDMGVIETYSNYWPTKLKVLHNVVL